MKKLISLVTLFGLTASVQATDSFVVETKIYNDNKLIGSPTLIVNNGEKASISVENLYDFTLTLADAGDSTVNVDTKLALKGEYIDPSFTIEIGKEASLNIGDKAFSVVVNRANSQ